MPVDTEHKEYKAAVGVWQKCRDVAAGQEAIRAPGRNVIYLPKLKGEDAEDYKARLARAAFFNATWRTIQGLVGMLFLKPPVVEVSANAEAMLLDVTQSGLTIKDFAKEVATEALTVGRVGVLTDYPRNQGGEMTVAQAQAAGMRPKLALYKAESIVNWACGWVDGRWALTMLVLHECCCECDPDDRFTMVDHDQWRCYELIDRVVDGVVSKAVAVTVYRKDDKGVPYPHEETFFPLMAGAPLSEIPFVFISSDSTRPAIELPPLIDLIDMNISHYQSTADAEHGAHKTALPQPWVNGCDSGDPAAKTFYMGGGHIWLLPAEAEAGMLEYTGQGLEAIEKRIEKKEGQMAVLGARMLEPQKNGVEAAETAAMHRSGEQSALTTQAETLDSGMTRALGWFDKWAGGSGEVVFDLNKQFMPRKLTAQELTALVQSWQAGGLTSEELFEELQGGGVIKDGKTFEEHEAQAATEAPRVAPVPAPAGEE